MRNIIMLCDGTENEISENISNASKLHRCLRKTEKTSPRQFIYFDEVGPQATAGSASRSAVIWRYSAAGSMSG